ncbi:MAG: hypothetical protein QMD46_05940 [Methanomicrobiales archaeon]|nr:hypothetical protein [Methanomicrobiales archaeon]
MHAVKAGAGLFMLSTALGVVSMLLGEPGIILLAFGEILLLAAVILVLAASPFRWPPREVRLSRLMVQRQFSCRTLRRASLKNTLNPSFSIDSEYF